uniref:RxLR effector protein n=1 Tax=Steinernema glaseri TaxID=37863 RepID=A0A1I7ZFA0_9BILA
MLRPLRIIAAMLSSYLARRQSSLDVQSDKQADVLSVITSHNGNAKYQFGSNERSQREQNPNTLTNLIKTKKRVDRVAPMIHFAGSKPQTS